MKKNIVLLLIICSLFVSINGFATENYPTNPIRIIIPFNPGGGSDILTRAVDKYLNLEQPRVLIYIPGASGLLGAMETLKAQPDGYTILAHNSNNIVAQYLSDATDIMLWRELEPICDIVMDHTVLTTNKMTGWTKFEDALNYAKENPGKLTWGVTGARGLSAVNMLMVQEATGVKYQMVPYDGGAATRTALLGGHIDLETTTVSDARAVIESGDAIPLAVLDDTRSPFLPDVPTLQEIGYDVLAFQPRSYYAPPGTPEAIIKKLAAAFEEVSKEEGFIKDMEELYLVVRFRGPEGSGQVSEDMYNDWKPIFDRYFQ
ncbi:MAG: tripartite tricarboxylate transporter substrate binding protein [Candidatus Atribacteria bacterium]|nr:tripartite tricarboxylate transporter substrate binding protein [Candidatus Atribacteria bacterium]